MGDAVTNFYPEDYVIKYFPSSLNPNSYPQFVLRKIVQILQRLKLPAHSKKILEYGNGPHPMFALGLSPVASEIILAEYEESHRDYVRNWLKKEPTSFDYSFYFRYTAELMGKAGTYETSDLEKSLRRKIVAITPCDITKGQCISQGYEGPYDIVFSSLCLEAASKTVQEYKEAMKKLVAMVKPEGYFVLVSTIREKAEIGFYTVNNVKLFDIALKRRYVLEACSECDLTLIEEDSLPVPPSPDTNKDNYSFFVWKK